MSSSPVDFVEAIDRDSLDLGLILFVARVSLFSLVMKVEGFCTRNSTGRKAYTKGRLIKWDVEVASFSFDLLLTSLRNESSGPVASLLVCGSLTKGYVKM